LTGGFAPVTGYRSGGPHGLEAGEWTDDTSMALALGSLRIVRTRLATMTAGTGGAGQEGCRALQAGSVT
jgi:hypothetical protein